MSITLLMVFILAYLVGTIPFGLLVTRMMSLGDLRAIGSGNIGATNVLRTGNKGAAALTLLGDMGKGYLAVIIAWALFGEAAGLVAAIGAFIGHLFPVWLGFRGGKGVATFLGVCLGLSLPAGLLCCITWLFAAFAVRISSVGALAASALGVIWMWIFVGLAPAIIVAGLAALVWLRHRENIARLLQGREPKIGRGK